MPQNPWYDFLLSDDVKEYVHFTSTCMGREVVRNGRWCQDSNGFYNLSQCGRFPSHPQWDGFFGVGIYMRASRSKAEVDMLYVANSFWSTAFTMANLVIALGVVCVVACALAIIAMRKTFGIDRRVSKAAYCAALIVLIIWSGFVAFTGISIVFGNMSALGLKSFVEASWKKSVAEDPAKACALKENKECKVCFSNAVQEPDLRECFIKHEDNLLTFSVPTLLSAILRSTRLGFQPTLLHLM